MLFTCSKLGLFVLALTVFAKFPHHHHHHHHYSYRHGNSRRGPRIYDYHPSSETTVIDLEQPTFTKRETEDDIYSRIDSSPASVPEAPKETPCKGLEEGGKKYIMSDAGGMLARCQGCGPSVGHQQSVGVHGKRGDGFAQWTFEVVNGKCAIKSDIGAYAARCNGCWKNGAYPDSVFNHVSVAGPAYSLWTVEKYGGSYAFKADTGKYLARCNGCVPKGAKSDFAFVHSDSPSGPALWTVSPI